MTNLLDRAIKVGLAQGADGRHSLAIEVGEIKGIKIGKMEFAYA